MFLFLYKEIGKSHVTLLVGSLAVLPDESLRHCKVDKKICPEKFTIFKKKDCSKKEQSFISTSFLLGKIWSAWRPKIRKLSTLL
jgi:hypothetical protein